VGFSHPKPGDPPLCNPGSADRLPYGASQARAATINASMPVSKVG
jgi:hypothetical protein